MIPRKGPRPRSPRTEGASDADPILGLETEFAVLFTPETPGAPSPDGLFIFSTISAAVLGRVRGLAARHRKGGHFLENGGFLHHEGRPDLTAQVLLEYSTPECSTPRELARQSRAAAQMLAEAIPDAERSLAAAGYHGTVTLGKNARDSHGNTYGCHENYRVSDPLSPGARALTWVLLSLFALLALPLKLVEAAGFRLAAIVYYAIYGSILGGGLGAMLLAQLVPRLHRRTGTLSVRLDRVLERFEAGVRDPLWRLYGLLFHYLSLPLARMLSGILKLVVLRTIRRDLPTFLATRIVFTGAGHVARRGPEPVFCLSEKAGAIRRTARLYWNDRHRPMLDLKNLLFEWTTITASQKRLHVMASDSNMSEFAEYLKFGTTALVLRAIASGAFPGSLRLSDPVAALHQVSSDPWLRVPVALRDGRRMTALEIQWEIWGACDTFVRRQAAPSHQDLEVLRDWRQILADLEEDPARAADRVDWVLKRRLIEEGLSGEAALEDLEPWREAVMAAEAAGVDLRGDGVDLDRLRALLPEEDFQGLVASLERHHLPPLDLKVRADQLYRAKKVDLKYHDIAAGRGYFQRYREAGLVRDLSSPEMVQACIRTPPPGTRAAARGAFVKRHHRDPRADVNWARGRASGERITFSDPPRGSR